MRFIGFALISIGLFVLAISSLYIMPFLSNQVKDTKGVSYEITYAVFTYFSIVVPWVFIARGWGILKRSVDK